MLPRVDNKMGQLSRLGGYTPLGDHAEVAVGVASVVLPRPLRATGILIQSVLAGIMFTLDGTDPLVEPGFVLPTDLLPVYIPTNENSVLTVVRELLIDASVRYQWVREEG